MSVCAFLAELDPPFRPVNGTESPARPGPGTGALEGLSFGWDAETLPGNALTGRVRDRERRLSADDDVCTQDNRQARASIATRAPGSMGRSASSDSNPADVSGPSFDRLNEDLHGPYSPTPP